MNGATPAASPTSSGFWATKGFRGFATSKRSAVLLRFSDFPRKSMMHGFTQSVKSAAGTVQEFDFAISEKLLEGQRLLVAGNANGGVYLLGYAAEMLLKTAYFRFTGAGLGDEVGPRLAPARRAGKGQRGDGITPDIPGLVPDIPDEFYHSLRFWAMLLQAQRAEQGQSWADIEFTLEFERCTERLYNNWWVEMRYRRSLAKPEEALQVLSDVGWLRTHQTTLWR